MSNNLSIQKHRVKITEMKKLYHADLVKDFAANPEVWTPCSHFEIGDEFITDLDRPWDMPAGFCGWAWGTSSVPSTAWPEAARMCSSPVAPVAIGL